MIQWLTATASLVGMRASNDDAVAIQQYPGEKCEDCVLVACDGVGGLPGSGAVARAAVEASLAMVRQFLESGASSGARAGAKELTSRFRRMSLPFSPALAATMAVVVWRHRRGRGGHLFCFWLGDTRIYLLDRLNRLHQVSSDDHDSERHLTAYVLGDGHFEAAPRRSFSHRAYHALPRAICLTTDGVHEACEPEELRQFLIYCASQQRLTSEILSEYLPLFLGGNLGDNASICLYYRPSR